jgi:hypothetical protein
MEGELPKNINNTGQKALSNLTANETDNNAVTMNGFGI